MFLSVRFVSHWSLTNHCSSKTKKIRELKDQHSLREKELRTEIENVREERHEVALQVQELEADLTSLRAQNSLFSEWMLVRNANATIAKKDFHDGAAAASPQVHPYHPSMRAVEKTSSSSERETMMRKEKNLYVHTSRVPQSPTKTMSMTTASPIKQVGFSRSRCLVVGLWLGFFSGLSFVCVSRSHFSNPGGRCKMVRTPAHRH